MKWKISFPRAGDQEQRIPGGECWFLGPEAESRDSGWELLPTAQYSGFDLSQRAGSLLKIYMYDYFCLNIYKCTMCVPSAQGG